MVVLSFEHGVIAEGAGGIPETVFVALEVENIAITDKPPVAKTRDVETEVAAVFIVDTRGLGEGIAELVVEMRRVVSVQSYQRDSTCRIKSTSDDCSYAPFLILGCGYFTEEIKPTVVVAEGETEDGLIGATEIMAVVLGVAVRMDRIGVDGLDAGELEFELFMPESEVSSDQMPPGGIVVMVEGVEYRCIESRGFGPLKTKGRSCSMQSGAIDRAVVTETLCTLSCRRDVHRLTGMEDRCQHKSLTERSLKVSCHKSMEVRGDVF